MNRQLARALNQWRDNAAEFVRRARLERLSQLHIMQLPRAFRRWRREVGEAR